MEKLFLQIVNISLVASWLILAVFGLRLVLRRGPKWVTCILWGLVAVRLVFPFSIESGISLIPSAKPLPDDFVYTSRPYIDSGVAAIDQVINPIVSVVLDADTISNGSNTGLITDTDSVIDTNLTTSVNPARIASFVCSRIWVTGIILVLLYAIISTIMLKRRIATATLIDKGIKQSERVQSPFVFGVFNPVIYLPYGLDEADLRYVIEHEKAHIKRRDNIWKPIAFVILAVYWFNPVIWLAYICLCKDIEAACDEKVIKDMDIESRRAYSAALLKCSVKKKMITACPVAFGENGVKMRIKDVMNYRKPAFWVICVAVLSCIIVAVCFLTNPKNKQGNNGETTTSGNTIEEQTDTEIEIQTEKENITETESSTEKENTTEAESSTEIDMTTETGTTTEVEPTTAMGTDIEDLLGFDPKELIAPEAGEVTIRDDSDAIAKLCENEVEFYRNNLVVSAHETATVNGKKLHKSRDYTNINISYGDESAEIPVDDSKVEDCGLFDIDGDGIEENILYCVSGARGWERLYVIGLSGKITVASLEFDWPEYTCLMKKDGIVIVNIPEFGEEFAVKIKEGNPDRDYFWDKEGNFLRNEYFNLDENGDYYIDTRFMEQTWHAYFSEGKLYFVRTAWANLGGPATTAFTCYEKYGYENGQLVLIERMYN